MTESTSNPTGTVSLQFSEGPEPWRSSPDQIEAMATSVSAIAVSGRNLWVCSDQTASVELLTLDVDHPNVFNQHRSFRIGDFVALPQGADVEIDLEGIDLQWLGESTGYLWLIGSHSRARKDIKKKDSEEEAIRALASVKLDQNRCTLMRIPFIIDDDGLPQLATSCPDPADPHRAITAGSLPDLRQAIGHDDHLGAFVEIPGKDNGLDIEGLAVAADRVYVGLRGPVLRGWAVILELRVDPGAELLTGDQQLRLRARPDEGPLRSHFLDLHGLGIRELMVDGDDLVILAGPTMELDGPVRLIRWKGGATQDSPRVVHAKDIDRLHNLPHGNGDDHAEGFTRLRSADTSALLVAYDSPANSRAKEGRVEADLFTWR
jgi:hypothetical protein